MIARTLAAAAALALLAGAASGQQKKTSTTPPNAMGEEYTALELLSPCQESDNDARWGQYAETECEQYLLGFVAALQEVGMIGSADGVCPPELNTADEVRWAFMRWVHASFTERKEMSARAAVLATLKESFPCE